MRSDGVRIIKATDSPFGKISAYDSTHGYMSGYSIDLSRKTAALMRQSKKGADKRNPESRLRQEGLVDIAIEIRADHDPLMVIPCDEGSGVSGQKKIYERPKFLELWRAIQDGTVGSVIVAREDRLFRDRFLTQPTQFAEECARRNVILIVAGKRCYDFRIQDDFKAFIARMQESYAYIDTHIKYMQDMRQQKLKRGEWVGSGLVAPYVLDRQAIDAANDQRKIIKEFGGSEEDERFITQAFRPVIYTPWHDASIDLFEKFRLFDFSRSRLGRYVEEKKYIFPMQTVEDSHRYIFRVNMTMVPGLGYRFAHSIGLPRWLTNLMHLGYAPAGEDEEGNHIYIEGAFEASIPRDLFEQCYEALTGLNLDGEPSNTERNRSRFTRKNPRGLANALLTERLTSPDVPMRFTAKLLSGDRPYYYAMLKAGSGIEDDETQVSVWESRTVWTMPVRVFDKAIVDRLAELAEHDKELAGRVEAYYSELNKSRDTEKSTILSDISSLEALIARYDKLLVDPAQPLSVAQEGRYLKAQADAEIDLEKAKNALIKYEKSQPSDFIPLFYRILGKAPGEFWNMDIDRQRRMMSLLVDEIQVTNISPHLYKLLLKWKDPVAQRWDCALIFKRNMTRSRSMKEEWTEQEDALLRQLWPTAERFDIYKALPNKSGAMLAGRAGDLGVQNVSIRQKTDTSTYIHRSFCYNDWLAACTALEVQHDSEEGLKILDMLNYYARTTTGQPITFWWVLPALQLCYLDGDWTRLTRPEVTQYIAAAARELADLLGITLSEVGQ